MFYALYARLTPTDERVSVLSSFTNKGAHMAVVEFIERPYSLFGVMYCDELNMEEQGEAILRPASFRYNTLIKGQKYLGVLGLRLTCIAETNALNGEVVYVGKGDCIGLLACRSSEVTPC